MSRVTGGSDRPRRPTWLRARLARWPQLAYGMGLGPLLVGRVLILTTQGRATGKLRKTALWYVRQGDTIYCLSGFGVSSDWWKNLKANPWTLLQVGKEQWKTRAEPVPEPLPQEIKQMFLAKYGLLARLYYRSGSHPAVAFPLAPTERSGGAGRLPS